MATSQVAESDPEARKIFEEVDRRRDKISFEQSDMKMIIYNSRGQTRERLIQSFSSNRDGNSNSLLIFEEPANVAGTGFLTISEGADEIQKLYLPALDRIQVISASQKSDRFMGSDFTYEDLGDQDPEDYRFELESKTDSAFVLKAEKKESSQYHYIRFYIDSEKYALVQAEYFDEDDTMIKRLESTGFQNVMEDVWRPRTMTMYDLINDRKTTLSWSNRTFNESIPAWRFTERGLKRGI
ncbi:MAG: outer membrane lipoprotein-sorting protein [Balneolaceae bacterium]|nr:outer membrane lipoprotein-sorting protein [Balneolaceae bacterium]